ncbi:MAG: NBR1-Ig-like domain-containing protein [Anaerolineales bacterium]
MKRRLPFLPLIALILATLSCILQMDSPTALNPQQVDTLAAQTMAYIQWQTYSAQGTQAQPPAADTIAPAAADTGTNTLLPSVTPSVTLTAVPCNWAQFVADVNYPDDTELGLSDSFTKTWRLKNIGSCTWTSGYALVFDHGDPMGAPAAQQLTAGTVAPGGTIDVSVNLITPNVAGTYQGFFKLRASDNAIFGIGADANTAFWVKVVTKAILAPPVAAPVTQQKSQTVSAPAGGTMSTTAVCDDGTVVTGGGFQVNIGMHVYTQAKNGNGWAVVVKNNTGTAQNLKVYAICLTLPSISSTQVSATATASGAGGIGTAAANCPAGSTVTGGGFTGKADGSLWTFFSSQEGNGWKVSALNSAAGNQTFDVYAVCLSGAPVTVTMQTGDKDLAPGATALVETSCPAGQVITGGGWVVSNDLTVFAALMSGSYWRVYVKNNGTHTRAFQARAMCLGVA